MPSRFLPTLRSVHVPVELVVEREDADRLLVGHDVDGRLRRRLAQVHRRAGHAPRPVEHEDQRDRRLVAPLERDRRQPLERRLPIARLSPNTASPPATSRPPPLSTQSVSAAIARVRDRRARDVAQDRRRRRDRGRPAVAGSAGRRTHRHVEAGRVERAREVVRARRRRLRRTARCDAADPPDAAAQACCWPRSGSPAIVTARLEHLRARRVDDGVERHAA